MKRNIDISSTLGVFVLFALMLVGFGAIWIGVFAHLEGGWGIFFGVLALLDRIFRFFKAYLKRNGTYWLDM